jgi:hypothetical protein
MFQTKCTLLTLHVFKEKMIVPCFAFAQNFQLKGYGQYGLHGIIVNVPTNLDIVQFVLPIMLHNHSTIVVFKK